MTAVNIHASDKAAILRLLLVWKQADTSQLVDGVTVRGPVRRSNSYQRTRKCRKTTERIESNLHVLADEGLVENKPVYRDIKPSTFYQRRSVGHAWELTFEGWVWAMEDKNAH